MKKHRAYAEKLSSYKTKMQINLYVSTDEFNYFLRFETNTNYFLL